jgi:hypothetical protein
MLTINNNEYVNKSKRQALQCLFQLMFELKILSEDELRYYSPRELDLFEKQEIQKFKNLTLKKNTKLSEILGLTMPNPILKRNDFMECTTLGSLRTTRIASDNRVQFDMENSTSMFYRPIEGENQIEVIADAEELIEEDNGLMRVGINLKRNSLWNGITIIF